MDLEKGTVVFGTAMETTTMLPNPPINAATNTAIASAIDTLPAYSERDEPPPPYVESLNNLSNVMFETAIPHMQFAAGFSDWLSRNRSLNLSCNFSCGRCIAITYTIIVSFLKLLLSLSYMIYYIFCAAWGGVYLNAECDHMLAIWLIVYGSISAFTTTVSYYLKIKNRGKTPEQIKEDTSAFTSCYAGIFGCFNFCWFITGAAWVYTMNINGGYVCVAPLFNMVFWSITVNFIIMAIPLALALIYGILLILASCCR